MAFTAALIQHEAYDVRSSTQGHRRVLPLIDQAAAARPSLIVLPECSYPGYYLGLDDEPFVALGGWQSALADYREKAREHGVHMVVGIGELEGKTAYNSAYLIGPDGNIVGRARKTFMWQFDSRWFTPGDSYDVFPTPLGRIAMIICADGRLPEISRVLTLKGAQIIAMPTNWVSSGKNASSLSNPQVDYIIPTRAYENGVWFLCANKVGKEADSIVYCGQSMAVAPDGTASVVGSRDRTEIVTARVDVDPGAQRRARETRSRYFRPSYRALAGPTAGTPLASTLTSHMVPERGLCHVGVISMERDVSLREFTVGGVELARRLAHQGADLVVFPEVPVSIVRDFDLPIKEAFLPVCLETGIRIAATIRGPQGPASALFGPDGRAAILGPDDVVSVGEAKVGFLLGRRGFVPEESRLLFLGGADIIVWQANFATGKEKEVAFTRAIENRVYVAMANCAAPDDQRTSFLVSPDGRLLAETFPRTRQAIMATLSPGTSRVKEVAKGTDVFRNRRPELYGRLGEP